MIAIKNADGTLVPVVEGLAGNQRTIALSLVHTNQKRAEIQLYEIEAPDSDEHPPIQPGQKPFGVLVLKRLPENPFGEVEITAAISVDSDLMVHIQAEAEGIKPTSAEFRLSGAILDQTLPTDALVLGDDSEPEDEPELEDEPTSELAPAAGGLFFDLEEGGAEPATESAVAADPFDFSSFDQDEPGLPAPSTSQSEIAPNPLDDDLFGLDEPDGDDFSAEFSETDPLGLGDGDMRAEATPSLASLDFDNFGFGDDQSKPEDGFADGIDEQSTLDLPGNDEADADEVPFELDLGTPEEPDAQPLSLSSADSEVFIDDPDDTDWGFDELADPADENLAAPAISLEGEDESLALGDEAAGSDDFAESQVAMSAGAPAREEPATPAKQKASSRAATKSPKSSRPPKPAKSPRTSPIKASLVSRLLRASVVLFGVSVIELGVYLALHFGLFP